MAKGGINFKYAAYKRPYYSEGTVFRQPASDEVVNYTLTKRSY